MEIDMNISNYSLSELLSIIGLENDEITQKNIKKQTNNLINKFKYKNPKLSYFFQEVQNQLLNYVKNLNEVEKTNKMENQIIVEGFSGEAIYPAGEKQITDWYKNEVLTQSDKNQTEKITQRKQKIDIFGNEHMPMNREQIATTDTYELPVKQDSLNPNLKNTINRFVNLDSQFRQYTSGTDTITTDYTCDLSDTLNNVLKLKLYSYQIPYSWYTIDNMYGNTCFWIIEENNNTAIPISMPPGNYTQQNFVIQLNMSFQKAGFTTPEVPNYVALNNPVYLNVNNGKITLFLYNGTFNDPDGIIPSFNITNNTTILFYDFTSKLQCNVSCFSNTNHYFNNTLGWIMGYRLPYINVLSNGNIASSILDLNGPKYLILVVDDYNQNHVNNSLISITQMSNTLKMPSYYSPDIPYRCISPTQQGNNLSELVESSQNGLLIAGKYEGDYTSTQIVLPSAPRTLTQSQIYTINSINNNNNNLTNYLSKAPTTSDILAILPIKTSISLPTGTLLVEFSGSLQDNSRTYFGPVNIERLAVKLLDDKGNILNLNGNDWCFTMVCECLYQY